MSNPKWLLLAALFFADAIGLSNSYSAVGRAGAVALLVGSKIYIQGGYTSVLDGNSANPTNDMLILPIDKNFDVSNPPWDPISGTLPGPALQGQIASCGGYNNTVIYFFGGQYITVTSNNDTNMLWTFDTTNNTWGQPNNTIGAPPQPVDSHSGVTRLSDDSIWIFGGEDNPYNATATLFGTTFRLVTYPTLSWSLVGGYAPGGGRQAHTANLLVDGRMVILGGKNQTGGVCPFSDVLVFDTNKGLWSVLNATLFNGNPVPRLSHVSVTTYDSKIIIHGGDLGPVVGVSSIADLAVLDMKPSNLSWYVPPTTGLGPTSRVAHDAVMVGTTAFILFGQTDNNTVDSNIYALDTETWTWLHTYNATHLDYTNTGNLPSNISPPPQPIYDNPPVLSMPIIIGVSVGGAAVLAVIVIACFLFCRRRGKNKDTATAAATAAAAAALTSSVQQSDTPTSNMTPRHNNSTATAAPPMGTWNPHSGHESDNDRRSPPIFNTNIPPILDTSIPPILNTSIPPSPCDSTTRFSYPSSGQIFNSNPGPMPYHVIDPNVYAISSTGYPVGSPTGYPIGAMGTSFMYNYPPAHAPAYVFSYGQPSPVPSGTTQNDDIRYPPPNTFSPVMHPAGSPNSASLATTDHYENEFRASTDPAGEARATKMPLVYERRDSVTETMPSQYQGR